VLAVEHEVECFLATNKFDEIFAFGAELSLLNDVEMVARVGSALDPLQIRAFLRNFFVNSHISHQTKSGVESVFFDLVFEGRKVEVKIGVVKLPIKVEYFSRLFGPIVGRDHSWTPRSRPNTVQTMRHVALMELFRNLFAMLIAKPISGDVVSGRADGTITIDVVSPATRKEAFIAAAGEKFKSIVTYGQPLSEG